MPLTGILEPEAVPGAVQRVGNKQGKMREVKEEGTRSGEWLCMLQPQRVEACVGISPHLKVPQRRGFRSPFVSLARCPSFNTSLIFFLLPAGGNAGMDPAQAVREPSCHEYLIETSSLLIGPQTQSRLHMAGTGYFYSETS